MHDNHRKRLGQELSLQSFGDSDKTICFQALYVNK